MIKSALQSSLTNDVKYSSMSAGVVPSSEYLISNFVAETSLVSLQFNVGQYAGIYKHLRLVMSARSTRAETDSYFFIQFNGDAGTNYNGHYLRGDGSAVASGTIASPYLNGHLGLLGLPAATAPASSFGACVYDFLDCFDTSKYTTTRGIAGQSASYSRIGIESSAWRNTAALTSIKIDDIFGNIAQGSRFSLYGVTA